MILDFVNKVKKIRSQIYYNLYFDLFKIIYLSKDVIIADKI